MVLPLAIPLTLPPSLNDCTAGNGNDFIITLKQFLGDALPTVCVLHIILIKVNSLPSKKEKQKLQKAKPKAKQRVNSNEDAKEK